MLAEVQGLLMKVLVELEAVVLEDLEHLTDQHLEEELVQNLVLH